MLPLSLIDFEKLQTRPRIVSVDLNHEDLCLKEFMLDIPTESGEVTT